MKCKIGTREWSDFSLNIGLGCSNDCLYCYARENALHYKRLQFAEEWPTERLTRNADITSFPRKRDNTTIMFPTTHDITPFYLPHYLRVARLALEAGNRLLIVSKPRLDCVRELMADLAPFRNQVELRFTIGTMDKAASRFWEPGAPEPGLRVQALYEAQEAGYRTSVSIEPMLAGTGGTLEVVEAVRQFVTGSIWIGRMNKIRQRVDCAVPEIRAAVEEIERLQADNRILELVAQVESNPEYRPLVRWKDSIARVVERALR